MGCKSSKGSSIETTAVLHNETTKPLGNYADFVGLASEADLVVALATLSIESRSKLLEAITKATVAFVPTNDDEPIVKISRSETTSGLIVPTETVQDDTLATLENDDHERLPVVVEDMLEEDACPNGIGTTPEKEDNTMRAETTLTTMAETIQCESTMDVVHQAEIHVIRDDEDHKDDGSVYACCTCHGNAKTVSRRVCM